jgi:hypothetical protein
VPILAKQIGSTQRGGRLKHLADSRVPHDLDMSGLPGIASRGLATPSGRRPMLSDVALRSIADNLAALRLDPLLHLKIAAAIVAPLMEGDVTAPSPAPLTPHKLRSPPRKAALRRKPPARKGRAGPVPTVYDGRVFPSRVAMARRLAPILGKSANTIASALLQAGDDAGEVVRRYRSEEPAPATNKAFSHDEHAVQFLKGKLAHGPCPASIVDDEVEAGRLRMGSVERAKAELGVVARRLSNGKGAVVHLCTTDQAPGLEA